MAHVVVGRALYLWGGYSYTPQSVAAASTRGNNLTSTAKQDAFAHADGCRLVRVRHGVWRWDALPPLPHPAGQPGVAAVGTKIYFLGGMDYDAKPGSGASQARRGVLVREGRKDGWAGGSFSLGYPPGELRHCTEVQWRVQRLERLRPLAGLSSVARPPWPPRLCEQ